MNILGFSSDYFNSFIINNYYAFKYNSFNMAAHSHLNAELMYCDLGECEIFIYLSDNSKEYKKIKLKKGQFIVLCSGVKHRLLTPKEKPCKIFNVEFSPAEKSLDIISLLKTDTSLYSVLSEISDYAVCSDSLELIKVITKLLNELVGGFYSSSEVYIETLILELLILISRCYTNTNSSLGYYISQTMLYIKENYTHNITIKEIAASVGANSIYLERIIKQQTNKTILSHINYFRLEQARKLISNTSLSLTDIAFHCGYGTRQSFFASFKKAEKISPSCYRENAKKSKLINNKQSHYISLP